MLMLETLLRVSMGNNTDHAHASALQALKLLPESQDCLHLSSDNMLIGCLLLLMAWL